MRWPLSVVNNNRAIGESLRSSRMFTAYLELQRKQYGGIIVAVKLLPVYIATVTRVGY